MKLALRLWIVVGAALACGACSTTPPPISAHNLERPSDIAFACVGLFTPGDGGAITDAGGAVANVVSGRPMYECNNPGQFDQPFDITRRTFGFVANSARGELSVIDLNNSKLVDLDLVNPETNVAPLGVLPEQMSASSDGCRIVTANRGSCDLTMVDIGTLMTPELGAEAKLPASTIGSPTEPATGPSTVAQEIVVRRVRNGVAAEPLRLNPQEVMFLPQDTSAISGTTNLCTRDRPHADPIGWNSTPTMPVETQWKALVTYPTCNLVALVDLPSGLIVDSVKVNPDGVSIAFQSMGSDPDCPVEDFCDGRTAPAVAGPDGGAAGSAADGSTSDGGSSSGTAVSTDPFVNPTGTRPSSLAVLPTGERAYVGLTQASFVAAIDVRPNQLAIPDTGGSIKLHENALGVNGVRLSVDPYRRGNTPTGQLGAFVGNDKRNIHPQLLYVIARDGTVRVVDVSPRNQLLPETECDVNVDPRFVPAQSGDALVPDRTNICWPTEPPDLAHRRPLARGPGITLPSIPRDVAFAQLETGNTQEAVLDGAYAFILTISGAVYEVNVAPTLRTEYVTTSGTTPSPLPEVQPLVNTLRDINMITFTSSLDPSAGPARLDLAPTVPALGPQISAINTTSSDDNATILQNGVTAVGTYVFFPQQVCSRSTPNPNPGCDSALAMSQPQRQTWNLTWEGDVFGPSFSGQLTFGKDPTPTSPLILKDQGVDFCQAGALPGDIVTLFGCTVDAQCGPGQVCRRSSTAPETADALPINGLCVPNNSDPTGQNAELNACAGLLNSLRRFEVVEAKSQSGTSTLTLRPEIDEITAQSLTTCAGAPRPKAPSSPMATDGVAATPCPPPGDDTRSAYACLAVDETGPLRCARACTSDSDCRSGRSCVLLHSTDQQRICADAPMIPPAQPGQGLLHICGLDQLAAYKVGAGSSFLVQGTAPAPYVPGMVDPTTFSCVPNPSRLDRIPYFQMVNGVRTPIPDCTNIDPIDTSLSGDATQGVLLTAVHKTPAPNPCLIRSVLPPPPDGGTQMADGGTGADGGTDAGANGGARLGTPFRVLFQNREIRFILGKFEEFAGNSDTLTFDVHGGFVPDQVVLPTTIDINTPNRIVVGPIDSQTQVADLGPTSELPYLFVIDQRRLGSAAAGVGATRGQILRINPRRATTTNTSSLVPIYDDPVSTASLWPIQ